MPSRALRYCQTPGCRALTRGRYCGQCRPSGEAAKAEQHRRHDAGRPSARQRGYTRTWEQLRRQHLEREPYCHDCMVTGRIIRADDVHHIVALRDGGTHEADNLMSLCRACHNARTRQGE